MTTPNVWSPTVIWHHGLQFIVFQPVTLSASCQSHLFSFIKLAEQEDGSNSTTSVLGGDRVVIQLVLVWSIVSVTMIINVSAKYLEDLETVEGRRIWPADELRKTKSWTITCESYFHAHKQKARHTHRRTTDWVQTTWNISLHIFLMCTLLLWIYLQMCMKSYTTVPRSWCWWKYRRISTWLIWGADQYDCLSVKSILDVELQQGHLNCSTDCMQGRTTWERIREREIYLDAPFFHSSLQAHSDQTGCVCFKKQEERWWHKSKQYCSEKFFDYRQKNKHSVLDHFPWAPNNDAFVELKDTVQSRIC